MSDEQLRELERRKIASGAPEDEAAWFRELWRSGALARRIEELVEETQRYDIDAMLEDYGILKVLPLSGSGDPPIAQVNEAVEAAGYQPLKETSRRMDREEAQRYLAWRLRAAPYGDVLQPVEAAERMSAELLRLLPTTALLFTNVGHWGGRGMSWSRGLTSHTMDDGIVAHCGPAAVVLWFVGED